MHYAQPQPEIPVIISELMNLKEPMLARAVPPNETLPVVAVAEGARYTRKVSLPANTALPGLSLLLYVEVKYSGFVFYRAMSFRSFINIQTVFGDDSCNCESESSV